MDWTQGTGSLEGRLIQKFVEIATKEEWLDNLVDLPRKKHKFLVIGLHGVGKTHFLYSLKKFGMPTTIYEINHEITSTGFPIKRKFRIDTEPFVFLDMPGQLGHERKKSGIHEAIRKDYTGVINIVSYGYHEYSRGELNVLETHGMIKEHFLKAHRKLEITALREIAVWLYKMPLITVITKADLWWDRRHDVIHHYKSGPYYRKLKSLNISDHSVVEYSSSIRKFYKKIKPSVTFDEYDRLGICAHLMRTLLELVGKG